MLDEEEHIHVVLTLSQIAAFLAAAQKKLKEEGREFASDEALFNVGCSEHMLQSLLFEVSIGKE